MNTFRHIVLLAFALLCAVVPLRAQSNVGESAVFAFDTRDYTTGLAAESAVFVFDTRVEDGLSGSSVSNVFPLDTQLYGLVSLSIAGPSAVAPGGIAQFTCAATYSNSQQQDITTAAQWSLLAGAPTGITLGGSRIVQVSSTVKGGSFTLHASYQTPAGQRFAEGTVTVGSAFTVSARQHMQRDGDVSGVFDLRLPDSSCASVR